MNDEKRLQELDEEDFGKFLRKNKLGEQWTPCVHKNWSLYKRITGVAEKATHEESTGLQEGYTRHWFSTQYTNLWYCEVRANSANKNVVSRYFHYYEW